MRHLCTSTTQIYKRVRTTNCKFSLNHSRVYTLRNTVFFSNTIYSKAYIFSKLLASLCKWSAKISPLSKAATSKIAPMLLLEMTKILSLGRGAFYPKVKKIIGRHLQSRSDFVHWLVEVRWLKRSTPVVCLKVPIIRSHTKTGSQIIRAWRFE